MKPREILEILKPFGWTEGKGRGHAIEAVGPNGQRVPISNHPQRDVPTGTLKKIERLTGVPLIRKPCPPTRSKKASGTQMSQHI